MKDYMPATEMNRRAEKTLDNWRVFFAIQNKMAAIHAVRRTPFGMAAAPQMENDLYDSMLTHLKAAEA